MIDERTNMKNKQQESHLLSPIYHRTTSIPLRGQPSRGDPAPPVPDDVHRLSYDANEHPYAPYTSPLSANMSLLEPSVLPANRASL